MEEFNLDAFESYAKIVVIGCGGGGSNAVNQMVEEHMRGVSFWVCNTDAQALATSKAEHRLVLGREVTNGLGAGGDPEVGRAAAESSKEDLYEIIQGANMVFIAAGMGGGTGTGASPVIANIAHDLGILTVAVVTMPFRMEGPKRYQFATEGIEELHKWVDSLLIIDNERLRKLYGKLPIKDAFGKADDVLGMATKGIAELITVEYALVRVDFADVETVMRGSGRAHMSVVSASGDNRALQVAEGALSSSLLDDNHISGAKEILLSFSVSDIDKLTHDDVTDAMSYIQEHASYVDEDGNTHQANIIWGASEKKNLADDELELVVVATRFDDGNEIKIEPYSPEADPDVFGSKPSVEPVVDDIKPRPDRHEIHRRPVEGPTIQPPQDKYKLVRMQQLEPAYTRQKQQFVAGGDSHTKTVFRPMVARAEEGDSQSYDMFS